MKQKVKIKQLRKLENLLIKLFKMLNNLRIIGEAKRKKLKVSLYK
jgi:hypothetical protein